jgi:general stress protein YciG
VAGRVGGRVGLRARDRQNHADAKREGGEQSELRLRVLLRVAENGNGEVTDMYVAAQAMGSEALSCDGRL